MKSDKLKLIEYFYVLGDKGQPFDANYTYLGWYPQNGFKTLKELEKEVASWIQEEAEYLRPVKVKITVEEVPLDEKG